jgi:hypothetical protein
MPFRYFRYYKNELNKYAHFCKAYHQTKSLINNQPDALFHAFIYSFHLSTCLCIHTHTHTHTQPTRQQQQQQQQQKHIKAKT